MYVAVSQETINHPSRRAADRIEHKTCSRCGESKPCTEKYWYWTNKGMLTPCRECRKTSARRKKAATSHAAIESLRRTLDAVIERLEELEGHDAVLDSREEKLRKVLQAHTKVLKTRNLI